MSFLAPLFMLGALAVAAPVIFHLIRRTTRDRVRFSSLMFLQPTPPRLTKRSRIEHWLLLILRALALALLAAAFARPFWKSPAPPPTATAAGGRTAVLIDVSASVRRDGMWDAAQDKARAAIAEAAARHDVALFTFDRGTRSVMSFDDWRSLDPAGRESEALARLGALEPGWLGTDLATALSTAAEALVEGDTEVAGSPRRLVVVSDFQEGSRLEAIQSYDWPKGVEIALAAVAPETLGNAGLQLAAGANESADADSESGARARVSNTADSTRETFQVGWATESGDASAGSAVDAYVPPGQSRLVTVPWPAGAPSPGRLRLDGDAAEFDNAIFAAPPPRTRVNLVHLGQADAADPRLPIFFLGKALPQSERLAIEVVCPAPEEPPAPDVLTQAGFIVVTETVAPAMAAAVRSQLESGTTALVVLTASTMADTLSALAGVGSSTLEEVTPRTYAMFGEIDFRHPIFAPFADPRFSDFTKIRFQRYRKLDPTAFPGARVVARFDSGDPALMEMDVGQGKLVILAAGWVAADSQLAVSSKFPPLLASVLEWSGATRLAPAAYEIGDILPRLALGAPAGTEVSVRTPSGTVIPLAGDATGFTETTEPGIYTVTAGSQSRSVPVNLDPVESRTKPLADDDFERLGVPMARAAERARAEAAQAALTPAAEAENRQKLWRWFLAAALAVLLLETVLAGRAARRALTLAETAP
ncbi:MAG: BatA domain-containing protein [Verrucomicrobiales bacterium]